MSHARRDRDRHALAHGGAPPRRDLPAGVRDELLTRTAVRLGWAIESNWTDPLLFLIYSVAKPVAARADAGVDARDHHAAAAATPASAAFVVIGSALWSFVIGGIAGPGLVGARGPRALPDAQVPVRQPERAALLLLGRGTARIGIGRDGCRHHARRRRRLPGRRLRPRRGRLAAARASAWRSGWSRSSRSGVTMAAVVMQTRQDAWTTPRRWPARCSWSSARSSRWPCCPPVGAGGRPARAADVVAGGRPPGAVPGRRDQPSAAPGSVWTEADRDGGHLTATGCWSRCS